MLEIGDILVLFTLYLVSLGVLVIGYYLDQQARYLRLESMVKEGLSDFRSYGNSLRASLGRLAGLQNVPEGGQEGLGSTLLKAVVDSEWGQKMLGKMLTGLNTPEESESKNDAQP